LVQDDCPKVCPTVLPFLLICKRDKKKKEKEKEGHSFLFRISSTQRNRDTSREAVKGKTNTVSRLPFHQQSHSREDTQNTAGPQQ
jgi:hypothetical protein